MTAKSKAVKILRSVVVLSVIIVTLLAISVYHRAPYVTQKVSAACSPTAPASDNGQVVQDITVSTAGSYRVWSRMKSAGGSNNSYYFRVDQGCTYTVGGSSSIPSTAWSWVNYQDGNSGSMIDINLTAGKHTIYFNGKAADVQLDKMLLLADPGCVPSGQGENCGVTDILPPVTAVTIPTNGSVLRAATTFTANATDNLGVARVEFYINDQLKATDTTAPYMYEFDTSKWANGAYTVSTKAYDGVDNVGIGATNQFTVDNDPAISQANNLLKGKTFTSNIGDSTVESGNPLKNINDGNEYSRWISTPTNNAAISTDMGASYTLGKVSILWAADTVKNFDVQLSADNATWKTVYSGVTNNSQRQLIDVTNFSQPATGRYFRVVSKDRWNAAFGNSIWEIGAYTSASNPSAPTPVLSADGGLYISDLRPVFMLNGWGPYEKDQSNGNLALNDGGPITIAKTKYARGIGVHANSDLQYQIGGKKTAFKAVIGLDDETGTDDTAQGTVQFEIYGDGKRLYQSAVLKHTTSGKAISVDITGVNLLRLVVNDGGDGNGNDHADWAEARVLPGSGSIPTPTPSPTPTPTPTPTPAPSSNLPGDVNGDKRVNAIDLSALLSHDGQNYAAADFNKDGTVGAADLAILLSKWTW